MNTYVRPDPYPPTLTTHKKSRRKPKGSKRLRRDRSLSDDSRQRPAMYKKP